VHVLQCVGNFVADDHVEHLFVDVVADEEGLLFGVVDPEDSFFVQIEQDLLGISAQGEHAETRLDAAHQAQLLGRHLLVHLGDHKISHTFAVDELHRELFGALQGSSPRQLVGDVHTPLGHPRLLGEINLRDPSFGGASFLGGGARGRLGPGRRGRRGRRAYRGLGPLARQGRDEGQKERKTPSPHSNRLAACPGIGQCCWRHPRVRVCPSA
jgi:hypothetical protein